MWKAVIASTKGEVTEGVNAGLTKMYSETPADIRELAESCLRDRNEDGNVATEFCSECVKSRFRSSSCSHSPILKHFIDDSSAEMRRTSNPVNASDGAMVSLNSLLPMRNSSNGNDGSIYKCK